MPDPRQFDVAARPTLLGKADFNFKVLRARKVSLLTTSCGRQLAQNLSISVEELQFRCSVGRDPHHDPVAPLCILEPQNRCPADDRPSTTRIWSPE